MMHESNEQESTAEEVDCSIGRIVSVTGSKAIVMLDNEKLGYKNGSINRPEMGTLLCITVARTVALGLVSALSVPVPAQREGDPEIWIAELNLVGELPLDENGQPGKFNRGISVYPALGDLVRIATQDELKKSFSAQGEHAVCVGAIRQDATIPAMVKTDDLLGKHFAILGTTGTGKSCTTALILRAILEKNPNAHIILLDPHNEYATAFGPMAEVVTPHNLHLPYWLLTFEELLEVLIGDPSARKNEVEILQELVPICKGRYGMASRSPVSGKLRRNSELPGYSVDTPVPYRISELIGLIDERMGLLENKKDLSPYRLLKARIETITKDQRYAFMFGSLTVNDSMAEVLGRIFRVPVDGRPITILELTGLPTEIVNVVVSVLCRMTFDFALWGDGKVPVTLVCEEAHRYVPNNPNNGFEPAKRAIAKIAKEGRKYGASLCIVTQRPAEIDPTILSQCNTVFALRMSNDRDQEIVTAAISDTGSGLLEFLPALGAREAIAFGDGVTLPVRIKFHELPKHALPRSSSAKFSEKWQESVGDDQLLDLIVERWRASDHFIVSDPEPRIQDNENTKAIELKVETEPLSRPAAHAEFDHHSPEANQIPAAAEIALSDNRAAQPPTVIERQPSVPAPTANGPAERHAAAPSVSLRKPQNGLAAREPSHLLRRSEPSDRTPMSRDDIRWRLRRSSRSLTNETT